KTDGRRIVTVAQGTLYVIDAASRSVTGRLALDVGAPQLLLAGDRVLVLGYGATIIDRHGPVVKYAKGPASAGMQAMLVDIAGPPRIISRYQGEGRLVDARQTGGVARVVLSSAPKLVFPYPATGDDKSRLQLNKQVVSRAKIDAWLPSWEVTTG